MYLELDPFISTTDLEAVLDETLVDPNALSVKIALDSACTAVRTYLGQNINYVAGDVEVRSGSGRRKLRLRQRPVRSVTSVYIDGDLVTSDQYSVRGGPGVITMINGSWWTPGDDNVSITYSHGWDVGTDTAYSVPADIRLVALNMARRVFLDVGADLLAGAIVSETIGDYAYELSDAAVQAATGTYQLSEAERYMLDPWRVELVGDTPTQYQIR